MISTMTLDGDMYLCSARTDSKKECRPNQIAPDEFVNFLYRDQRTILTVDRSEQYSCQCPRNVIRSKSCSRYPPESQQKDYSSDSPCYDQCPRYLVFCRSDRNSSFWSIFHRRITFRICIRTKASCAIVNPDLMKFIYSQPNNIGYNVKQEQDHPNEYSYGFLNDRKGLCDFLVLAFYLLSLLQLPLSMSAPVSRDDVDVPATDVPSQPLWVCPCGDADQELDNEYGLVQGSLTDREILQHIILQAKISLDEASKFKFDYVTRTFGVDFHEHHQNWRKNHLGWLPDRRQIPKELGEDTRSEHLEKQAIDLALGDTYEFLQKVAVGMEQVAEDQARSNGEFKKEFNQTIINLKMVLCEIQVSMREREIEPRNDVPRDIMNFQVRKLEDLSHRNLRDWLIFREYMNVLEYIIQVFEYIQKRLPS